ncbi:Maf family protein [Profundibacter sp.]
MTDRIILASGSETRQELLRNAGVEFEVSVARIDEDAIRQSLEADSASPRDIADALAEFKAQKIALKQPDAFVIGCDQTLDLNGQVLSKPSSMEEAQTQLQALRGKQHTLYSAAVIYENAKPVWRHVGKTQLEMHDFSNAYLESYVTRNWHSIRHSVGAYKLEEEGSRLFSRISGDYFVVLGLPLLEMLTYLSKRGILDL